MAPAKAGSETLPYRRRHQDPGSCRLDRLACVVAVEDWRDVNMRGYARNAAAGHRTPVWLGWAAPLLLLGCTSVRYDPAASFAQPSGHPPVSLTIDAITAPVVRHGEHELDWLRRIDSPAARLREAYVLQEVGRSSAALRILNQIRARE